MLSKADLEAIRNLVKDEIIKFKDEIMSRLDNIDQELAVTNGYGEHLEDHETRITTLEKTASKTS